MSRRLRFESERIRDRIEHGDPSWPSQLAVGVAIVLNVAFSDSRVTIGPDWLLPAVEGLLLVVLVIVAPARVADRSPSVRRFSLGVIALVSLVNLVSLGLLVHYLLDGGAAGGRALLISGAGLWATNVLLFAVWYWELDRGGPVRRFEHPETHPDLLFPQMGTDGVAPAGWRPGFLDYLYTSLTNATAFSPTDTLPLTHTAKAVMAVQSVSALLTIGLVIARAVNVLG